MTEPVVLPAGLGGFQVMARVGEIDTRVNGPHHRVVVSQLDIAGDTTSRPLWYTADQTRELAWQLLDLADEADAACGEVELSDDDEPAPEDLEGVVLPTRPGARGRERVRVPEAARAVRRHTRDERLNDCFGVDGYSLACTEICGSAASESDDDVRPVLRAGVAWDGEALCRGCAEVAGVAWD